MELFFPAKRFSFDAAARRNIFYPSGLLKALGWPSEKDRRAAAGSRFLVLLTSASARVELSTITLDDEALVTRSILLDEHPQRLAREALFAAVYALRPASREALLRRLGAA